MQHFNITGGSYDGDEVCKLVGSFLVNQLEDIITNRSVGVYKGDVLAIVHKSCGPQVERLRKNFINFFKQHGFQNTIKTNKKINDILDIYLDLENDKFYPYRKPNEIPLYVHRQSNHPLNILKQLPKMASERLSNLSYNENEFIKASDKYQNAFRNAYFKGKLIYTPYNQRNRI